MSDLEFLLKVSRPRFWLYVFGPYLIGLVAGATSKNELVNLLYILLGIYFLLPANLLIYGVNDIYDYETDKLNKKKADYEVLVTPERRPKLWLSIFITNFAFIDIMLLADWPAAISAFVFVFLSIFYSAPPIRAKSRPFLDSLFNILYILPGVFSYALITHSFPPVQVIFAAGFWTAAMHAYSAIPDIESDRDAKLNTIATVLGSKGTLIFCLILYTASTVLSYPYLSFLSVTLGAVYAVMIMLSFLRVESSRIFFLYKFFPLINAVCGFVLFWFIVAEARTK